MEKVLYYLLRAVGTIALTIIFTETLSGVSCLVYEEFIEFTFNFTFPQLIVWIIIFSLIPFAAGPIFSMIFGVALACCNGRKAIAIISSLWIINSVAYTFKVLFLDTLPDVTMYIGEGFWYYFGAICLFANIVKWDFMLLTSLYVRDAL